MRATTARWSLDGYRQALETLCQKAFSDKFLVIASNRGPVEFRSQGDAIFYRRGQGGLVTAISSVAEVLDSDWVASPISEDDVAVVQGYGPDLQIPLGQSRLKLSYILPVAEDYRAYYDQIANTVLWFLQHGIHDAPHSPDFDEEIWAAWESYRKINTLFAEEILRKCQGESRQPVIMVHDYHLYLVPGLVRKLVPGAMIHHFTHISWPGPDMWRQIPQVIRREILESLLSCDIVGFHTHRYVKHFLLACQEFLGAEILQDTVYYQGHSTQVRAYPISIDPEGLRQFAQSVTVQRFEKRLFQGDTLNILQVARTDPSKNILRSLKSFEYLLDHHPKYHGRVVFWALMPASRQSTAAYQDYLREIRQKVDAINQRFGREGWLPIQLFLDNSYARAIAAMKHFDILLVNSLADGMNLVAKEGPIVNLRDGVLLLSEGTGAWDELGEPASLTINPYDIVGTAEAMLRALSLSRGTRHYMHRLLIDRIQDNPIFRWAYEQLSDIHEALQD